jgi:hypothetical protein
VFLSELPAQGEVLDQLIGIEEDLSLTRKIARAGISTEVSARDALLPILPLNAIAASSGVRDLPGRLRSKPGVSHEAADLLLQQTSIASFDRWFLKP